MLLSDGRRIVSSAFEKEKNFNGIVIHPDFRVIILANRPGTFIIFI